MVKENIDGISIKEFIIKNLVYNSNRDIVDDFYFQQKTGITKLGTLTYHTKKHNINSKIVYEYGIENAMIPASMSFEDWYESTRGRKFGYQKTTKTLSDKDILYRISKVIGLDIDLTYDEEVIKQCILDFISYSDFNKMFKNIKEELKSERNKHNKSNKKLTGKK